MLYALFDYLHQFEFPGAGLFQYISFRASLAIITSLILSLVVGKRIIYFLQRKQIGETIRNLGLEGQMQKKGTPTMGGIIILTSILIPVLLFGDLTNVYVVLMLITTIWLGFVGFLDDYIKVFKKNKIGLRGKFKLLGQVVLGVVVGLTMYLHEDVVIREKVIHPDGRSVMQVVEGTGTEVNQIVALTRDVKSTKVNVPFLKNNEFDYARIIGFLGEKGRPFVWIVFILAVIFILTAVSNGANLTDGLDGLAAGTSAIIGTTLGILAYVSGNTIIADYLNIMYIPHSGELVVYISAFIGAMVGFLWYNSYPAQVFMGDTGSLAIGGIVAVFAILIRKELLIPILAGIFLVETISVMMQVSWFKYTKNKYGEGRRIFLMSPLHHHFQKKGYPEPKIVTRFWIVSILLAVITIVTLKIR
ncbi:MAG: phospho-N-acetylmuramoyl-pentapeptide-transferase [Bacteroidota bacterium]|nr:MAG: phospho-N-acetylmuramoyl-pentapeptide-transferase [Bacteroidota bacterium]